MNKEKGFLQIIAIVVIFVVLAILFGKNPVELWESFIEPLISWLFNFIVHGIEFLISFFTSILKRA